MINIFKKNKPEAVLSVHRPNIVHDFAAKIQPFFHQANMYQRDIIFVCIGTDRSTGDALGPLTGSRLQALHLHSHIYGTLDTPVHAANLSENLQLIEKSYTNPYIIAIDACLGRLENVGVLSSGYGSVKPGTAVKKNLPAVGDAYITGIVNVSGFMEHMVLQSTRLNLVIKMADIIARSIAYAMSAQHQLRSVQL